MENNEHEKYIITTTDMYLKDRDWKSYPFKGKKEFESFKDYVREMENNEHEKYFIATIDMYVSDRDFGYAYSDGGSVRDIKKTLVGIIDEVDNDNKTFVIYIPTGDITGKITGRKKYFVDYKKVNNPLVFSKGQTLKVEGYINENLMTAKDVLRYADNGGGVDDVIRFDVDFYDSSDANKETSVELIIRENTLEKAIQDAIKKSYELKKNYIEFYHRGFFLGSINFAKSKDFIEGRFYEKFISNNLYANGGGVDDVYYIVTGLENRHDLQYGDSQNFKRESEAIKKAEEWFNKDDVGESIVQRVNKTKNTIDTVYRINNTYPLGERVVERPRMFADGGDVESLEPIVKPVPTTKPMIQPKPSKGNPYKPKTTPRPKASTNDFILIEE